MDRMVARYQKKDTNERLFNREFESLVIQWLNDLADGKQQIDEEPEKTLALAGFLYSVTEGRVTIDTRTEE